MQAIDGVPAGGDNCRKFTAPRYAPGCGPGPSTVVRAPGVKGKSGKVVVPAIHSVEPVRAMPLGESEEPPINCAPYTLPERGSTCATYADPGNEVGDEVITGIHPNGTPESAGRAVSTGSPS